MALIAVDDPGDPRLATFRLNERGLSSRPQRRSDAGDGLFLAEGDLVVERALAAGYVPHAALADGQRLPPVALHLAETVDVFAGGERLRAEITGLGAPQPIVATFRRAPRPTWEQLAETANRLVLVEAVDNPVNVGGIVRNAAGLGWDGLILDATSADPLARRALRVSMGHALTLPHARVAALGDVLVGLGQLGFETIALTPTPDATDLAAVAATARVALVVGAERAGLSAATLAAARTRARIPMRAGVDSLNAAAATAIACWALRPTGHQPGRAM